MFCSKCGAKNNDGAKFCKGCGQAVSIVTEQTITQPYQQTVVDSNVKPPKRVALYALVPFGIFVLTVALWGVVNLVADTENPSPAVSFFNDTLIPLVFAFSFIAIPVGIIYAVYSNSKNFDGTGTIKCGNCNYIGQAKSGRRTISLIFAWMAIIIFWPITLIYHLVTHKYLCPKCNSSFVGLRNKDGAFTAPSGGIGPFAIVLVVILVIAIIGILASVVLASLNSARDKGEDAMVKSNLSNARAKAELYYDSNSKSYDGFCLDKDTKSSFTEIDYTCNDDQDEYAITASLNTGAYYCVDSMGSSEEVSAPLINKLSCSGVARSTTDTTNNLILYTSTADGFSVKFPKQPTVDAEFDIATDDPTFTFDMRSYEANDGTNSYLVYSYTYSDPLDMSDPDEVLATYLNGMVDASTKLLSSNYTYMLGNRALEFKLSIEGEEVKGVFMLTDESVIYLLMYNYFPSNYSQSSYDTFINSFKLN